MTIDSMARSLMEQWPTPMDYDGAMLVVDALMSVSNVDPEDVNSVAVIETELGGIDIQLAIDEDKMPKVIV